MLQKHNSQNKGNFKHNTEVFENQKGKLTPYKWPQGKNKDKNFCIVCTAIDCSQEVMWRHFQLCKFNPSGKTSKPDKTRVRALCAFAEPAPAGFCDAYWKFLNNESRHDCSCC